MVLAIGIVVDDAIVVVENVERWIEHGHCAARRRRTRRWTRSPAAVIAIAFGLSAVFVPVAFISGITGQFYRQFALTISFSTLLSAFNSLTLSPALAALLLKPRARQAGLAHPRHQLPLRLVLQAVQPRRSTSSPPATPASLRQVVRFSVVTLAVYAGLLLLTYGCSRTSPPGSSRRRTRVT